MARAAWTHEQLRQFYASSVWRRLRQAVLERDGHRCRIRGPNCTRHANEVDHIVPILAGGAPLDPANCRASCRACNQWRVNRNRSMPPELEKVVDEWWRRRRQPAPSRNW